MKNKKHPSKKIYEVMSQIRDRETGLNIIRVQNLCKLIAQALKTKDKYKDELSLEYSDLIYHASSLHDIGKIAIPDKIPLKKGKQTEEEYEVMKTHVSIGTKTLSALMHMMQLDLNVLTKKQKAIKLHMKE